MTLPEAVLEYQNTIEGIDEIEATLTEAKKKRDFLLQTTIPGLLHEAGQSSCELETGEKVNLETVWGIEVPKGTDGANDYGPIAEWLRAQGFDAIIQDQVRFQKGAKLDDIFGELDAKGIAYQRGSSVHWMSLRKVIREHMETGGEAPPESAAKVKVFEQAKIK